MIHGVLQFTLRIAFCCVLHRCKSQDIHRAELFKDCLFISKRFFCLFYFGTKSRVKKRHERDALFFRKDSKGTSKCRVKGFCFFMIERCFFSQKQSSSTHEKKNLKSRIIKNDPSAGSPTDTLLRLLLPLDDKIYSTSRHGRRRRRHASH